MTIETYIEQYRDQLGPQLGETLTLRRGSFGVNGRMVRVATFHAGLLWEQGGQTILIPATIPVA